ncbi:hypothetical protein D9M73_215030 [compost metagenome]
MQGARGHHRQQQTFLAVLYPPAHRLALQAELPLLSLALGLKQQRHRPFHVLAMQLGLFVEPQLQAILRRLHLLQLTLVRRSQATDHQPYHQANDRQ